MRFVLAVAIVLFSFLVVAPMFQTAHAANQIYFSDSFQGTSWARNWSSGNKDQAKWVSQSGGYLWLTDPAQLYSTPQLDYSWSSANLAVTFVSYYSYGDGAYTWYWDFGDGGTSASPGATHTYGAAGTFTATVQLTDSSGHQATISHSITVAVGQNYSGGCRCTNIANQVTAPPRAIANSSIPILSPTTPDGFFFFAQFRLYGFNLTYGSGGGNRVVQLDFGLRNCQLSYGNTCNANATNYIAFKLVERDVASGSVQFASQSVYLSIVHPMMSAKPCLDSTVGPFSIPDNSCNASILYNPGTAPIDLNSIQHNFNIMGRVYPNHNYAPSVDPSWLAFNIDQNAWLNVTQRACLCIVGSTGSFFNMYPFIETYATTTGTYTGSIGTFVSLVAASNYQPDGLVFPKTSDVPYVATQNPVYVYASAIGGGNVQAGGIILTILTLAGIAIATASSFMLLFRMIPVFIITLEVAVINILFFTFGVLPLFFVVTAIILSISATIGVIKAGIFIVGGGTKNAV